VEGLAWAVSDGATTLAETAPRFKRGRFDGLARRRYSRRTLSPSMRLFHHPVGGHARLSTSAVRFLDYVERRPELLERAHFKGLLDPDFQFQGLQPWPTFLSAATASEIGGFVTTMDRLIKGIPARVFANDPGAIASFFGLAETDVRLILHRPAAMESAISRPDYMLTPEGFKFMEVNVGSHLEGWHLSAIAGNYAKEEAIQDFLGEQGITARHVNTTRTVLAHFIRAVVSQPHFEGDEVNLGIAVPSAGSGFDGYFSQRVLSEEFAAALDAARTGLRGRCILCPAEGLKAVGSAIHAEGVRLHALYDQTPLPPEVYRSVFRASMARGVEFLSGLGTILLSDKRMLAILSDPERSPALTVGERQFVERYVPWTRVLAEASTGYRGREVRLPELALSARDALVLKRGQSTKQADIFIGPATKAHAWEAAVRHALAEGCWIVQEFLGAEPLYYQYGLDGYTLQNVVFASFAVGGAYAGNWLRIMPTEAKGPINRSHGADIGLCLETRD